MFHILYVDDEPELLELGKIFLEQSEQFVVDTSTSAVMALTLMNRTRYDAIISDYQIPEMDGIELLKTIRTVGNTIPFILFTGRGREEVVIQALNEGADFYLHKGGEPRSQFAELSNKIQYAVMRRRAEESAKQNEAQLRQIIDLVPHMIFANDWDGNFLLVNRALARRYHTTVDDLVGKSLETFHADPAELRQMLEDNRDVIRTGTIKFVPNEPYIDVTGDHRTLQTTKVPFTTLGNNQQAVLGIAIDVTDRKKAETALQGAYEQIIAQEAELRGQYEAMVALQQQTAGSQRMLSSIIDFLPDATFAIDTDGKVVSWNKAIEIMTGIKKEDILGKGDFCYALPFYGRKRPILIDLMLHYDESLQQEAYPLIKREGETLFAEASIPPLGEKPGKYLWFAASPLYSEDGVLVGAIESVRDITQFKRTEQALRKSQRMLEDIMDLANLLTWECDLRTGTLTFNNCFSTLCGPKKGQDGITCMTLDAYLQEIVHPGDREILEQEYENARKTTDPQYVSKQEYRIVRMDGEIRYIETCVGIVKDEFGRTIKAHGVNQDITGRKIAEEGLRKANRQLSLLSGITRHDILNKITGILGYLSLAEMKVSDPLIDEYLGKMESAILEIRSQVDFTRIYQDLGTNEPQWIALDKVIPRPHALLTVSLIADVEGVEVFADPMLEKIFTNLLDNSLRHGQRVTSIRVSSHLYGKTLVVVWEDDGIGIPAAEKDRVFDKGFGKNTGFGLFLIREVLSLTGITIIETGIPGNGARFEITVPTTKFRFSRSRNDN